MALSSNYAVLIPLCLSLIVLSSESWARASRQSCSPCETEAQVRSWLAAKGYTRVGRVRQARFPNAWWAEIYIQGKPGRCRCRCKWRSGCWVQPGVCRSSQEIDSTRSPFACRMCNISYGAALACRWRRANAPLDLLCNVDSDHPCHQRSHLRLSQPGSEADGAPSRTVAWASFSTARNRSASNAPRLATVRSSMLRATSRCRDAGSMTATNGMARTFAPQHLAQDQGQHLLTAGNGDRLPPAGRGRADLDVMERCRQIEIGAAASE